MARPKKEQVPNTNVTLSREQFDELMGRMNTLEDKVAKTNKQGIETSAQRLLNRPQPAELDPMEVQESIQVLDQPATIGGKMLKDSCPFCKKFHAGLPTILDLTGANKYACRRCGKHWEQWALKPSPFTGKLYGYSEALEQGNKKRVEYAERIQLSKAGMAVGLLDSEDSGDANE